MADRFDSPYRAYDVLEKIDTPSWNEVTRKVVTARLRDVPGRRFFTEEQWDLVEAICARLVPQPDRESPVPIVPWIDHQLLHGQGPGYRYEGMPREAEAWRLGLQSLERESRTRYGRRFGKLAPAQQDDLLGCLQQGRVTSEWESEVAPERFFMQVLNRALAIYYAHPSAWSEIGFGGPASPRGYVRLGRDEADPWEAREEPTGASADG